MKYHQSIFPLLIAPFFLSGIKQKINPNSITENKWSRTISGVENFAPASEISIANTRIVEGNSGQRTVQVMVSLSLATPAPITVAYHTGNGTALAGSDYVATNDTVRFSPGQIMQKITLTINGDVAIEADETFKVFLTHPVGAIFLNDIDSVGTVTIVNDDFKAGNPSSGNPSNPTPSGNPSIGSLSFYEVRFTYTGYTTTLGTPSDSPCRPDGKVVMTGLLAGAEKVSADYDINYEGILQLDMDIDICTVKSEQLASGGFLHCGITIFGSGPVKTELKILYDGRGAYIQTKNESQKFLKSVTGSCDQELMDEEFKLVPNETITSIFNGIDLPMLTNRTLRVGRYVSKSAEGEFVVEVLRVVKP